MSSPTRKAFTLIELLVVIAIIAILIALLVPAVQRVRESANRTQCANNIKQLALGCQSYHDEYKKLPTAVMMTPGISRTSASTNFGPNWIVQILPYIEQAPLFHTVEASVNSYMINGDATWRSVKDKIIPTVICPSDMDHNLTWDHTAGDGWARGNYACNAGGIHQPSAPSGTNGLGWLSTEGGASPVYGSNGNFGGPVPDGTRCGGVMCINFGIKLQHLSDMDGTSNTILLNEVRNGGVLGPTDPRGTWAVGMPGASVTCAGWTWDCTAPNNMDDNSDDGDGAINRPELGMGCWPGCPFQQATARSMHPGGCNAAFADGSVRFIFNEIAQDIWWGLNCRDDAIDVGGTVK